MINRPSATRRAAISVVVELGSPSFESHEESRLEIRRFRDRVRVHAGEVPLNDLVEGYVMRDVGEQTRKKFSLHRSATGHSSSLRCAPRHQFTLGENP